MSETKLGTTIPCGGQFLLDPVGRYSCFSPEDFSDDEIAIGKTASDFMEKEVQPYIEQLEKKDYERLITHYIQRDQVVFNGSEYVNMANLHCIRTVFIDESSVM